MPFSQQDADVALNFFERILKHSGEWYGDPFLLTPWQEEALTHIFGDMDEAGERMIRLAYLEVPKKTGKTEFVAGLVLMFLSLEKLPGCEVYGAASVQRQALNVYRAATAMVEQSPVLSQRLRIMRSTHRIVKRSDPNSFYAAIAADGDFSDGVNPKFVVADELHRWRTRKQIENWDVLRLGGIARKHKTLTIAITTAGVKSESPLAWRLHEKTERIADGVVSDPTFYGRIYAADKKDNWEDEATWKKANPSLEENGGFLKIAKIREEYEACLSDPEAQASFKRYYLNLWDQKENRAIDMQQWEASAGDWTHPGLLPAETGRAVRTLPHELLERFFGRVCYCGVDLSLTTDLSAAVFVFPDHRDAEAFDVLPFFWMPEKAVRKRELKDGMPYGTWSRNGYLELSEGTAINYADVKARLKWGAELFDVREFCFDRYNSREMSTQMIDDGVACIEIAQTFTGLSEATKKLLKSVQAGKFRHGGHPVLRFNASCLSTKSDGNDLVRPVKPDREKDTARIDGIAAAITAMARAVVMSVPVKSVYASAETAVI